MKFSIITVCYNPGAVLRSAVASVQSQSYSNVEYWVVDGGSTDGTVEYLANLKSQLSNFKWVSEPDEGLYDALNKGIGLATGDVIGFVHADDVLAHSDILQRVADVFAKSGAEAVYGDLQYVRGAEAPFSVVRHWRSGAYARRKLGWGWMPPHPTFFLKRAVYEKARLSNSTFFDTSFSCAADYDFMMRVLSVHGVVPAYLPEVLVKMRVGGVSNRSLRHVARKSLEDWRVIRRNRIGHFHTLVWKNMSKLGQFFVR